MTRKNLKTMEPYPAVDKAVRECIKLGVLKEYLEKNRAEVITMWLYEYDEEKHLKNVREEGREEGLKEGREEGRAEERALRLAAEERVKELEKQLAALQKCE